MAGNDDRRHVAVALSGGGHRAGLFSLGALLYLVDAGKGPEIATVSSISGGSITNGYVGLSCDLATVDAADFARQVAPLGRGLATSGTLWRSWLTYAFLAVMVAVVVATGLLVAVAPLAWSWVIVLAGLVVLGWVAQRRSAVAVLAFDRALYSRRGVKDMHDTVTHVVCAADFQTAEQVYFSSRFVYSWRTGWGTPGDLRLARAVQASACLPGAFAPVRFPVGKFGFSRPAPFRAFHLTDGGVYDNMGTEWPIRLAERRREDGAPPDLAGADQLVVVNGSAGRGVTPRRSLRLPLVGEVSTLLAVKDVLYDQTTAVRRRLLNLRFQLAGKQAWDPDGELAGVLVQIDRSPYELPDKFARFDDEVGLRAKDAIARLEATSREEWKIEAGANAKVKTKLSRIPPARAASVLRHAYVLTMVNAHVLLDYPLLDVPGAARFEEIIR
jgi:predicted acylesterase/phospholipase RssA